MYPVSVHGVGVAGVGRAVGDADGGLGLVQTRGPGGDGRVDGDDGVVVEVEGDDLVDLDRVVSLLICRTSLITQKVMEFGLR
jgi:hypothetical protein